MLGPFARKVLALVVDANVLVRSLLKELALALARNKARGNHELATGAHLVGERLPRHSFLKGLHARILALLRREVFAHAPMRLLVDLCRFDHKAAAARRDHAGVGCMVPVVCAVLFARGAKVESPASTEPGGRATGRGNNMHLCPVVWEQQAVGKVGAYLTRHVCGIGKAAAQEFSLFGFKVLLEQVILLASA